MRCHITYFFDQHLYPYLPSHSLSQDSHETSPIINLYTAALRGVSVQPSLADPTKWSFL